MTRRPDTFGVALVGGLFITFLGAGWAAVSYQVLSLTELSLIGGGGIILIIAHQSRPSAPAFRNTFAHGDARTAHASETLRAASGDRGPNSPDHHTFLE